MIYKICCSRAFIPPKFKLYLQLFSLFRAGASVTPLASKHCDVLNRGVSVIPLAMLEKYYYRSVCCHVFIIPGGFSCYRILMSFVKPGSPHFQGVINIGMSPIPDWKMAPKA